MIVQCIGTGSSGNCYVVGYEGQWIMLDCGVSPKKTRDWLYRNKIAMFEIEACCITHEHGDHASAWPLFEKTSVPLVMTFGTYAAIDNKRSMSMVNVEILTGMKIVGLNIPPRKTYETDNFNIRAIPSHHDAWDPANFMITNRYHGEVLLYITDCQFFEYKIMDVTDILIECNYDEETLIQSGTDMEQIKRIRKNHMSLESCREFLVKNAKNMRACDRIHVIHMSDRHCNEALVKRVLEGATGKEIIIF